MDNKFKDIAIVTTFSKILMLITIISIGIFLNSLKSSDTNRYMVKETNGTYIIYKLDNFIKTSAFSALTFLK